MEIIFFIFFCLDPWIYIYVGTLRQLETSRWGQRKRSGIVCKNKKERKRKKRKRMKENKKEKKWENHMCKNKKEPTILYMLYKIPKEDQEYTFNRYINKKAK